MDKYRKYAYYELGKKKKVELTTGSGDNCKSPTNALLQEKLLLPMNSTFLFRKAQGRVYRIASSLKEVQLFRACGEDTADTNSMWMPLLAQIVSPRDNM